MDVCSVETGFLRKKPCGHPAVAHCTNCEQPLCGEHAVPQLTEGGKRSGKFMCQECTAAMKVHDKGVAAADRAKQDKKRAEIQKAAMAAVTAPPPPKKPAAPPAGAAAPAAPAAKPEPAAKPAEPEALEFTPSGTKHEIPRKPDGK
jgi:hypothetical protein